MFRKTLPIVSTVLFTSIFGLSALEAALPVQANFLETIVNGQAVQFVLPDGRMAVGTVDRETNDFTGRLSVEGRLTAPEAGRYYFQRQTVAGVQGAFFGNARFDQSLTAYRLAPGLVPGTTVFESVSVDEVVCRQLPAAPPAEAQGGAAPGGTAEAPQNHPIVPIPPYQNGVIPLQSLPGATGVLYLDFDGEKGPFAGWGNFDAAPSGANNTEIREVWARVAEDFQAFNLNVTTDRRVFDNAAQGSRQHCILTPTNTAAPGAGGVAYIGSFDSTGDVVCWGFYSTGKAAAEVASHEIGHTLRLGHDGRTTPNEGYYGGHGSGETGWAPIMGVGYYQNLTQWSKGEYTSANNLQDDLTEIINNNNVDYRADDSGATLSTARYLEIQANNSVVNEGIIETSTDVDAFRFKTTGGAVTLTVNPVSAGPDLDIRAELYNSADGLVASNNGDTQLSASITTTLAAGEYTLRVDGVGRGDPLADGYSDYATIGAYLISGTIVGGEKPDRFSIAENVPNGSPVGSTAPRNSHGASPLAYAITAGNTTNAFAINATTGAITVADSSQINYEALSSSFDDPATFELFVTITDATNPTLNESIRTVVTVTNVNENPVLTGGGSLTVLERTKTGTVLRLMGASDPDLYDFPSGFAITSGNTGGVFALDANTGVLTVAGNLQASTQSTYTLVISAHDQGTPQGNASTTLTINVQAIPAGYVPGTIVRTYFEGIGGNNVSDFTGNAKFPNNPDSEEYLTSFDALPHGDNYGSTVRGYVIPPVTGTYTFYIATDDGGEVRLGTNATPGSASVIASSSGATDFHNYTRNTSQKSLPRNLTAGVPYYIEARQKEGGGDDYVSVAWESTGIARQEIPGLYLAPYYQNYAPKAAPVTYVVRENAFKGATVDYAKISDVNAGDAFHAYAVVGGTGAAVFGIDADTGRIFVTDPTALNSAVTPSFTLTIQSTDNGTPNLTGSGTATINVLPATDVGLRQEIYEKLEGGTITALTSNPRYPNSPSYLRTLTSFDTGPDITDYYGSRIRGYVIPPTTGSYTFYLQSDDDGQLRLSTTSSPANAVMIASIVGNSDRGQWTRYASQKSAAINLTAGQKYYIETIQRDGIGGDYVQVGWTGPGISSITILPPQVLAPYNGNVAPVFNGTPYAFAINEGVADGTVVGSVAASDADGNAFTFAIVGGDPNGAFAIDPLTGVIRVANRNALVGDQVAMLQVGVQDNGGEYNPVQYSINPLKSTVTTVSVDVIRVLKLLSPTVASVNLPAGVGIDLLVGSSENPGAVIAWSKLSGPGQVTFDQPAGKSTGAVFSAIGSYVLRCTETVGAVSSIVEVTVNAGTTNYLLDKAKVGSQALEPTTTYDGSYRITGGGAGMPLLGTQDDLCLFKTGASGDVTLTARVLSVTNVNGASSRAGLMIREATTANSRVAFCGIDAQGGGHFTTRLSSGVPAVDLSATAGTPYWVRLTRTGNNFTAQFAPDASGSPGTWTSAGPAVSIQMNAATTVGFAAWSGSTTTAGTAVIDRFSITPTNINIAPYVSAGPDVNMGATTTSLAGAITDDGLPTVPGATTAVWSMISGSGSATFAQPAAAATTATFSTGTTYVLRLHADDGIVRTFDDMTVLGKPIEIWREQQFGGNAGNVTLAGDRADPDRDGMINLLEYALQTNPNVAGPSPVVAGITTVTGKKYLRLIVPKNPAATDVVFEVQAASEQLDSAAWSNNGTVTEVNSADLLRVRDSTELGTFDSRFMRLRVTRP